MRLLEIEKMFEDENDLDKVLEECKADFDRITYYNGIMKQGVTADNPAEATKALNELTGIRGDLNTVLAIAKTEKENREKKYYHQKKMEIENAEKKFVSASTEKEASAIVSPYRRIANYVEAKVEDCKTAISTLQSTIKHLDEEMKLAGRGKGEQ